MLDDLNEAQREAVRSRAGPLVILAGAGTGKTRVISRRAAYAIETGVVRPNRILLVTFTDKAATEMVERMSALGQPGVMARTFHAHAVRQLDTSGPAATTAPIRRRSSTRSCRSSAPLARPLPGHYRFTPAKDIADDDRVGQGPPHLSQRLGTARRRADRAPIPADLFARIYAGYERAKERARRVDFEDMLALTVELLESDDEATAPRSEPEDLDQRRRVPGHEPAPGAPARAVAGRLAATSRVVGDPDQTIYTFTGATPDYLLRFADKHPGARTIALTQNYRSTPQVLALANKLTTGGPRGALTTDSPAGPEPTIDRFAGPEVELAALVEGVKRLVGAGTKEAEIAVLVRINAQLPPIEDELTRAGIAYTVRGQRFYMRTDVRDARALLRRTDITATGGRARDRGQGSVRQATRLRG